MGTIFRGGTVVNHGQCWRADVLTRSDTIVAVGPDLAAPAGVEVVDASGAFLLTGGVDPRTHLEFPFMNEVLGRRVFRNRALTDPVLAPSAMPRDDSCRI